MPCRRLQTTKASLEIDLEHSVPVVVRHIQEGDPGKNSGIVYEDVDTAERFSRIHDPNNIRCFDDVSLHRGNLAAKLFDFPLPLTEELKSFVNSFYGKVTIEPDELTAIIDLMQYDKKNVSGKVNFVLLDSLEKCQMDVQVNPDLVKEGLLYYMEN